MPILTPSRTLGWGWTTEGKNVRARADNVIVGLERYMRLFPDAVDIKIIISRKDEASLGFMLRKLTAIPVVTIDGKDTPTGMIFFQRKGQDV